MEANTARLFLGGVPSSAAAIASAAAASTPLDPSSSPLVASTATAVALNSTAAALAARERRAFQSRSRRQPPAFVGLRRASPPQRSVEQHLPRKSPAKRRYRSILALNAALAAAAAHAALKPALACPASARVGRRARLLRGDKLRSSRALATHVRAAVACLRLGIGNLAISNVRAR